MQNWEIDMHDFCFIMSWKHKGISQSNLITKWAVKCMYEIDTSAILKTFREAHYISSTALMGSPNKLHFFFSRNGV